jgi:hypothetical protein
MKLRAALIGIGTLMSLAVTGPAAGQAKPSQGVVTPEMRSGRTQFEFGREFDIKRLTDPLVAGAVHDAAGEIASCLARRGGKKAGDFLGGVLAEDAEYSHIGEALTGKLKTCANTNAAAPAIVISGVLAEQLVLEQAPVLEDRAPVVAEDDAHAFFGELTGPVTYDNIAGCLAVYSPGLAYKVVQTKAGSDEETAALQTMYARTPECMMSAPPESIPMLYQRGALATALYLWSDRQT